MRTNCPSPNGLLGENDSSLTLTTLTATVAAFGGLELRAHVMLTIPEYLKTKELCLTTVQLYWQSHTGLSR